MPEPSPAVGETGVIVRDGFVPGSLCEQLRTQMMLGSPELCAASKTMEMPVAIPSSLHARVMSVLQTGFVEKANPELLLALDQGQEFEAQAMVQVPARISAVGVQLHQDRYVGEGSGLVKGLVVVVGCRDNDICRREDSRCASPDRRRAGPARRLGQHGALAQSRRERYE